MTTATRGKLTDRQARVLTFIRRYIERNGWAPTIREICDECEISSTSVAGYNLAALEAAGFIRRGDGARMIALVEDAE
ncbi:MAG TPA: MarR family transcriptional regulator [Aggregatilinea sp.]|uniref:LexA family protein n=1 Tax=Aggregatilinea sp. TaxID=2806333 RepID=UPI002CE0FFE9|nr:winged helix DNA-binding protein [Aggregatilinea sp.]HML22115.1 MarR family transcriptional regulator [Aggregatilinea sp.]